MSARLLVVAALVTLAVAVPVLTSLGGRSADAVLSAYDQAVLNDDPVAYWPLDGSGRDLSGNGHLGTFPSGTSGSTPMPNADRAVVLDGAGEHMTVDSSRAFSIPTTGTLTWEGWIRPSTLQFPASLNGYVDWMGKCQRYSPSCEWEARLYNARNGQGRASRISAYAFNPSAGLGSAADWQPQSGVIESGEWVHVVGEYQTRSTPSDCSARHPGTLDIWVNGVRWSAPDHYPTGCMSQYDVRPVSGSSSLTIGTMAFDSWFAGAVGKVAVYDHLLTDAQVREHFTLMTGVAARGVCAETCTSGDVPDVRVGGAATPTSTPEPTGSATPSVSSSPTPSTTTTPTPATSSTASPSPSRSALLQGATVAATVTVDRRWDGGYCADVSVVSTTTVDGWSVRVPVQGRVTSVWNAQGRQDADVLTLSSVDHNARLAPGDPEVAGFCAAT